MNTIIRHLVNFAENYDATELKDKLASGSWKVKFVKVNGETRLMICTRDFKSIHDNVDSYEYPTGKRIPPDHQIVVWDLEKKAYRSFRVGSILSIEKYDDDLVNLDYKVKLETDQFKSMIAKGTWNIKFKLVSGDEYNMICTREFDKVLPSRDQNAENSSRYIPENQIIVWDLDHNGFRSFRYSNLISYTKISNSVYVYYNKNLMKSKSQIEDELRTGVYRLRFTKRDGSDRIMICTLDPKIVKSKYEGDIYPHLITVWDLEKKDFRNIVYRSIYSMEPLNKNFSMNENSELITKLSNFIHSVIPLLNKKWNINIPEDLLITCMPMEGESPAYYMEQHGVPIINFDIDKIKTKFKGKEKFIAYHELCHLATELYLQTRTDLTDSEKLQLSLERKGHGRVFMDILNSTAILGKGEFDMQFDRHIGRYIGGSNAS